MEVQPNGCLGGLLMLLAGLFGFLFVGVSTEMGAPPIEMIPTPAVMMQELVFEVQGEADTETISRTAAIFEQRLSALGVSSYYVAWDAEAATISAQIPNDTNAQTVIEVLSASALLEFVDVSALSQESLATLPGASILTTAQPDFDLTLPAGALTQPDGAPFPTVLTGEALESVEMSLDATVVGWQIGFTLTEEGAATFGSFTESHIGKPLAIVLDGRVLSAPLVQARIDREGIISGAFTQQEASALTVQLSSGPLPVPVTLQTINLIAVE